MIKANLPSTLPPSSSPSTIKDNAQNISSQKLEESFRLFSKHLKNPITNNMLLELVVKNLSSSQRNLLLAQSPNPTSEGPDSLAKQPEVAQVPGNLIVNEKKGDVDSLKTHQHYLGNQKPFVVYKNTLSDDLSEEAKTLLQHSSSESSLPKSPDSTLGKNLSERVLQELGLANHLHPQHVAHSAKEAPHLSPQGYYAEHPGVSLQQRARQESAEDSSSDSLKEPRENLQKSGASYFFKIAARCFVGAVIAIVSMLVFMVLQ
jgi:hypothetical protein